METLKIHHKDQYAIIEMDHGKVNAIDTELAFELGEAFRSLEKDASIKGVILTGRPHCFSAGLNLMKMSLGGIEGARKFWTVYLETLQTMVRFSKPMVCAISGYAPAGGTVLAFCADYRIMGQGEKHTLGMNEFNVSLLIPELLCDICAYVMGERQAWEAVQSARMFNSDQALKAGYINESVDMDDVLSRAEIKIQSLLHVLPSVYAQTKAYLRKDLLKKIDKNVESMVDAIEENLKSPDTQKMVMMFMESLKKKDQ